LYIFDDFCIQNLWLVTRNWREWNCERVTGGERNKKEATHNKSCWQM
jgi:hypothetical protein